MPTVDTSTGISIKRDRERTIPDVDVQFLPTATMLNGVSYTGKDLMTQIWGAEKTIVYGIENQINENFSKGETYSRQLSSPSNPSPGTGSKVYGVSISQSVDTYQLPTLVYLANSMILTPYLSPVNTYLTKNTKYTVTSSDLDTYGKKVTIQGSADDQNVGSQNTWDTAVSGNPGSVAFTASVDNRTNGTYQETVRRTETPSQETSPCSGLDSLKGINRVQTQPSFGGAKVTDFFTSMSSTFSLKKNQPFGLSVSMFSPAESWLKKLCQQESTLFGNSGTQGQVDPAYFISKELRKNTVTFIEFGGGSGDQIMLVIYQQRGKVECYKLGTQQVQTNSQNKQSSGAVGGNNGGSQQNNQATSTVRTRVKIGEREIKASADSDTSNYLDLNLAIYPIGNQLVVSDGEDGLRVGVKAARHDSVAIFNFENVLNIAPGPIKITTYLGSATYVYSHLLHISQGVFASPKVNIVATGSTSEPVVSLDFEGRIGGGTVEGASDFHFPMGTDTSYDFLSDSSINVETLRTGGLSYKVTLTSNENDDGDEFKRIYSPRIYSVQARVRPQTVQVAMNPIVIDKKDVIRIDVNQTCLGLSASVTLNNRALSICPPAAGGKYNVAGFSGVKPIQIQYGLKGSRLQTRFVGYVTGRTFSLGAKGTKSDVTLKCEDVSIKAKNSYAENLPIFDGWCHLAAFYYLAKEAGYGDDEIVFNKAGSVTLQRIINQGGGDTETMTGGCFDGHQGAAFLNQVTHAPLPLPNDKFHPFYMFTQGTRLWDCMMEIKKFSTFYLFANQNGQLVYAPPENVFNTTGLTTGTGEVSKFVEHGGQAINNDPLRFTELQSQLNVEHRPINSKNVVVVIGYDTVGIDLTKSIGKPIIRVQRDESWPNNTNNPNYIPWRAVTVLRSPMWNDTARIAFIAAETFKRLNRPYVFVSWSSFGQIGISAYDLVIIDETLSAETGVVGNSIVVSSITDKIDANTMSFFSSYEGEIVNPPTSGGVAFDSQVHGYTQ